MPSRSTKAKHETSEPSPTGTTSEKIAYYLKRVDEALQGGGEKRIAAQHEKGKYTARERIDKLLDPGTFVETGQFLVHKGIGLMKGKPELDGDGVVTGYGRINGRLVYVYSQDFTILGGSLGNAHARKIVDIYKRALKNGAPVIGFNDSGGARIQEGVDALAGYGDIFFSNVNASGVIPQISVIVGPSAGGAVYSPALTDFIIMTEDTSHMFITGPSVVEEVMGEKTSFDELGGAGVHAFKTGVAQFAGRDEDDSIELVRNLLQFIPSNNLEDPPIIDPTDDKARTSDRLDEIIPDDSNTPYDMKEIIHEIFDHGQFMEVFEHWGKNIIIGFARLNGVSVGIVANQPKILAGALDIDASIKGGKFIRFCDAFNIPIISLVDVPGFLPGLQQEHGGIIRNGAKLLYAYCEATVPKITVITRKAYGGAYIVMGSKHLATDYNFAWPTAEIAVMGAGGAVKILHGRKLNAMEDDDEKNAEIDKLTTEYKEQFYSPFTAAKLGHIDEIIMPSETRPRIIEALWPLLTKRESRMKRKHGNMPL
ncbi:MAG: acyl-CoA carboxylase subunit beta [Candidatus Kariarchaeaceae archaeon]|jgi:acetyl-CoA carboxylase carboxyltransferase component